MKEELQKILELLESRDQESQYLGYSLLQTSEFKKFMRNKVWSEDGKRFYRFRLFSLRKPKTDEFKDKNYTTYYNYNKLEFAIFVVRSYLNNKLKFYKLNESSIN